MYPYLFPQISVTAAHRSFPFYEMAIDLPIVVGTVPFRPTWMQPPNGDAQQEPTEMVLVEEENIGWSEFF